MEQALARLHQAIDYLKDSGVLHKQQDIADTLDVSKSNLSQALKGNVRYLTNGFLKRFVAAYSDYIDEHWLLTGEGEMAVPDKTMKPHISAKAAAGFLDGISNGESGELHERIPGMPEYDFTINAEGNSMLPEIKSGDTLACRWSTDRLNPPIGKICIVDSKDGAAVKVIQSADEDKITLHSLNARYKDYSVAIADINHIAVVVGLTRTY